MPTVTSSGVEKSWSMDLESDRPDGNIFKKSMKFYYVYIVQCADISLYTGLTNNLERRLKEHNDGLNDNSYTSKKRPVHLIFHQEFMQFEQAEYFEKKIKRWSRAKKLALANEEYDLLPLLAECRNESHSRNKNKN